MTPYDQAIERAATPLSLGLSAEQLAARRLGIGGSDAGKIMEGGDAWHRLWLDKMGRSEPEDLSRVLPVQMGLYTEPFNIAWFEREMGLSVFGRGEVYVHPEHDFIRCTLDGMALIEHRPAIVQAKHVNAFSKIAEVEQRYYPQVAHEMLVTGAQIGFLTVLIGTQKWECVEIRRDRDYTAALLARECEFWRYVEADTPPPLVNAVAAPERPSAYRKIDLSTSNMWCSAAADWLENIGASRKCDRAAKQLRGLVEADVGEAAGAGVKIVRSKDGKLLLKEARA